MLVEIRSEWMACRTLQGTGRAQRLDHENGVAAVVLVQDGIVSLEVVDSARKEPHQCRVEVVLPLDVLRAAIRCAMLDRPEVADADDQPAAA